MQVDRPPVTEEIPFPPAELERLEVRKWILQFARKGGVGAEIGVFRGHFSEVLAEQLSPSKLFLVDPWTKLGESFGWGEETMYTGFGKLTTQYAFDDTRRRIGRFDKLDIEMIEATAAEFFPSLGIKLDWVYLDASHHYKPTLNELGLIDRVLKSDGVIMGDDWQPNRGHKHHGVFKAVNEFVRTRPYEFVAAGPAGQWCIRRRQEEKSHKIVINKHPGVLHAAIDIVRAAGAEGAQGEIGGVVVLGDRTDANSTLWVEGKFGKNQAAWGVPSPLMAKAYPHAINGKNARFSVKLPGLKQGDAISLVLSNENGGRIVLGEVLLGGLSNKDVK